MSKFVIFAHPRSGSTSLARVLGLSKDVKMAIEPFHPDYSIWNPKERDYSKIIKNPKSLDKALNELFSKYSAIKVLDYQFPEKIYFEMLKRKDLKIIFLRRKNLLAAAISNLVAEQTSEWHKTKNKEIYNRLKPISIKKITNWIKYVKETTKTYQTYLKRHRKGEFLELYYEDLYSNTYNKNLETINNICALLTISPPPKTAIEKYMNPSNAKINYNNIYRNIPNYKEILKEFQKEDVNLNI